MTTSVSKTQELVIYNSLNGQKELFKPIHNTHVGMYVCGPTVYSDVHLGNCRTFVSFDLVFRYLTYLGYKVRYVRNITDVGHLENDADHGEDKIAKKARLEQLEPMEVVQRHTLNFHSTLRKLNTLPPSIEPTATGHIIEQIEFIKTIINNGFAYEVDGSVYFDVKAFDKEKGYGKLSKRNLEDMENASRALEGQQEKRNPQDFALWKKAEPKHIMRWASPWGQGFPGWHLECSAMSAKYLGDTFDIHGGGMDLKFPHHECEIAQAESCTGHTPVNYWMHANMLTLNGKKMSKSTGNTLMPLDIFERGSDLLEKTYSPSVVRFFMLQAHYRSVMDFSNDALAASEKGYQKLMEAISLLPKIVSDTKDKVKTTGLKVSDWVQSCYDAMNDDFNSPVLIARLFEAVKYINQLYRKEFSITNQDLELLKQTLSSFVFEVLGLQTITNISENENSVIESLDEGKLDVAIQLLIDLRNEARASKDFATSDRIRNQLQEKGIVLKDSREGTTYVLE